MSLIHSRMFRSIAATVAATMILQTLSPLAAHALTGGPAQPEFSSFEPVATTDMVNTFTGQFTYNLPIISIPGPNGSGYSMSLSYHSGASPEEEASWVGYGWTLNPGAIIRNVRGYPDDYHGDSVRQWNKMDQNWTVSVGQSGNIEAFSNDQIKVGMNAALRYNNYKGFGYTIGAGLEVKGIGGLGYSLTDGEGSFSAHISPAEMLSKYGPQVADPAHEGQTKPWLSDRLARYADAQRNATVSTLTTFGLDVRPTNITPYSGASFNVSISNEANATFIPMGFAGGIQGNYTYQKNQPVRSLAAYGYMYSAGANGSNQMDYYVEREAPYTQRDYFLGVPFAAADIYSVNGEGLAGGFRLYNKRAGHFHVPETSSSMSIYQAGGEVNVGSENGVGVDVGVGRQKLDVKSWNGGALDAGYKFDSLDMKVDEPYFFRMTNDLGGSVTFADDDAPNRASLDGGSVLGFKSYDPVMNDGALSAAPIKPVMNGGKRSGRSTYVGYSTMSEMAYFDQRADHYLSAHSLSYNRDRASRVQGGFDGNGIQLGYSVSEFSLATPQGMRYTFGLPVYSRKEKNLQYGIRNVQNSVVDSNYMAYAHTVPTVDGSVQVNGEERDDPYASMYLLTEVDSPDYVDVAGNGPTSDDPGSYVLFGYDRAAGNDFPKYDQHNRWGSTTTSDDNAWYRWRIPYNGLLYHRNSMSDPREDRGSMTSGEKEIYYLKTIETKTHIAVFVTDQGVTVGGTAIAGSGQKRKDAYEASHFEYYVSGDSTATTAQTGMTQNQNKMRKLERIELYTKAPNGGLGKLIQTVHFEYDYSLCQGLPNSYKASPTDPSAGKLTLRRVYTEYNGVAGAKVSPFVFGYEYKTSSDYSALPSELQSKYTAITHFADALAAHATSQNPNYNPFNIDRWGNYQQNGSYRYDSLRSWNDQLPDLSTFDPAAWQLKWIRLPSGGEIHVQYEQNTYSYVQDKRPMVMVRLGDKRGTNQYYLNTQADLGISNGSTKQKELCQAINEKYAGDMKIYFKFLYSLTGGSPSPGNCSSEYISGYAKLKHAEIDAGGLWVELEGDIGGGGTNPVSVLNNFIASSRGGMSGSTCFNAMHEDTHDAFSDVMSLLSLIPEMLFSPLVNVDPNPTYSFVRVPLGKNSSSIQDKRGGGIRVKRLLMYDPGIETGAASLYGTEYLYQFEDGSSSGVATNEPAAGREENALVDYLDKRRDQNSLQKIIAGRDKDQFEGPIGESLLPAPSIGYARVLVRNIHTGNTSDGYSVNEFYTAKDYPLQSIYRINAQTGLGVSYTDINPETDPMPLQLGFVNYSRNNIWATQGYSFVLNNMHGQPKAMSVYAKTGLSDSLACVASQFYTYFQPGESVKMMYGIGDYRNEYPGKEMEVAFEGRSVEDVTVDGNVEVDIGVGIASPLPLLVPWATAWGSVSYSEEKLKTHVTCKVVRYPAIQKSMTVFKDGATHTVENVAFDPASGSPLITRSYDGYSNQVLQKSPSGHDRVYQSYAVPAYQQYPAMGQKAANERLWLKSENGMSLRKMSDGHSHWLSISFSDPSAYCNITAALGTLTPGDLIRVTKNVTNFLGVFVGERDGTYYVDKIIGNRIMLLPTMYTTAPVQAIENVDINIIRSGRTNQLTIPTETITTYASPSP